MTGAGLEGLREATMGRMTERLAIEERLQIHKKCPACAGYLQRLGYVATPREVVITEAETHLRREHHHGVGL